MRLRSFVESVSLVMVLWHPAMPAFAEDHVEHEMPKTPVTLEDWARGAQIYPGLGHFHRKISSSSSEAQSYFDQGMRLLWAFNHDEASRSFARAAQIDPRCAICLWGFALTVGPNYNMPMMAQGRAQAAFDSLQRAVHLKAAATPVERALIEALRARYPKAVALDPTNEGPVLSAYAAAMRQVAHRYPQDSDMQVLFAESLMNIHAWNLWSADGKPNTGTQEIVATLEAVLKREPSHPGANHYYIHAVEASPHPEKGLIAAQRLEGMMPAAGHLEHMPAHIFQRVGRYEEAAEANRNGAAADRVYIQQTQPPDYYGMYLIHNYQFLAYSAAMEGRRSETLEAAHHMDEAFDLAMLTSMPGIDWYAAEPYLARVRFARWDEILALPRPDPRLQALTGGYLYAVTMALAAKKQPAEARKHWEELEQLRTTVGPELTAGNNPIRDVLALAATEAHAQVELSDGKRDFGIDLLRVAARLEDGLAYDEPSAWFFPVRHLLGAELLAADRAREAEEVYREDLKRNPENGWSLFGLEQALEAQHHDRQAAQVHQRFQAAWKNADISLTSSRVD